MERWQELLNQHFAAAAVENSIRKQVEEAVSNFTKAETGLNEIKNYTKYVFCQKILADYASVVFARERSYNEITLRCYIDIKTSSSIDRIEENIFKVRFRTYEMTDESTLKMFEFGGEGESDIEEAKREIVERIFNMASDVARMLKTTDVKEAKMIFDDCCYLYNKAIEIAENENPFVDELNNIASLGERLNEDSDFYEKAKAEYILSKYGKNPFEEQYLGKKFFLTKKNDEREIIGYVTILSKDESGLGFKVYDEESEKKYYHVDKYRLKYDMREFNAYYNEGKKKLNS